MSRKALVVILAVALLAAAYIARVQWPADVDEVDGAAELASDADVAGALEENGASILPVERRSSEAGAENRRGFDLVESAGSASRAYELLIPRADAGSIEALLALRDVVEACYSLHESGGDPQIKSAVGDVDRSQLQALARLQVFCDDPVTHAFVVESYMESFQERLARAAEAGDQLAIASTLALKSDAGDSVSVDEFQLAVDIARKTSYGEAMRDVIRVISAADDAGIAAIRERVFHDVQSRGEVELIINAASEWAACDIDSYRCGRFSISADLDCLYLGECYSHLTRREYLRTRALSDKHFEQMNEYLRLLDELLFAS